MKIQLSKAEEEIASALSCLELPSVNEQRREIESRVDSTLCRRNCHFK